MDKLNDLFIIVVGLFFIVNYAYVGVKIAEGRKKTNEFIGIKYNLSEWDYKMSKFTSLIVGIGFVVLGGLSLFGFIG